jgi:hypothetical protein
VEPEAEMVDEREVAPVVRVGKVHLGIIAERGPRLWHPTWG